MNKVYELERKLIAIRYELKINNNIRTKVKYWWFKRKYKKMKRMEEKKWK